MTNEERLAAQADLGLINFGSVSDLLADTILSYSAASGRVAVAAGEKLEAQGFRYEVAASVAADHHVETTGGVKLYVLPLAGKYFAETFGLVSDLSGNDGMGTGTVSGANQAAKLQGMLNAVPSGSTIDFRNLRIRFNSTVSSIGKDIKFTGNDWYLYGDGALLTVAGTRQYLTTITSPAQRSARSIEVADASGVRPDDVLILHKDYAYSFYGNANDNRDYRDGEFIEVESVSGNVITFKTLLKTWYFAGSDMKVYRANLADFHAEGGTIEGSASLVMNVLLCTGLGLNINVYGGTTRALYLNQCYRGFILPGGRFIHRVAVLTGNNYGISVSNCQDVIIYDVYAHGSRHGVALGGAPGPGSVPCRNIVIWHSRISNDTPILHAADIHGWAVRCYFRFCDVDGSAAIGGIDCGFVDGWVVAKHPGSGNPGSAKALLLTEVVAGVMDFRRNNVSCAPEFQANAIFGVAASSQFGGGYGDMVGNYHVAVDGIRVDCKSSLAYIASMFHNMPGNIRWTFSMNDISLTGDYSGLQNILTISVSNTLSHPVAPARADSVSQNGVQYDAATTALNDNVFVPNFGGSGWTSARVALTPRSGSNANGRYTRHSDGSMDCYARLAAGTTSWTFPSAFYAAPESVQATAIASGARVAVPQAPTSTAVPVAVFNGASASNDVPIAIQARGRYVLSA